MENLYTKFKEFFEILPRIESIIEPYAKRSGLTSKQSLLLIVINNFNDFDLSLYSDDITVLSNLGLITEKNGKNTVTGTGAILVKSFINKLWF